MTVLPKRSPILQTSVIFFISYFLSLINGIGDISIKQSLFYSKIIRFQSSGTPFFYKNILSLLCYVI